MAEEKKHHHHLFHRHKDGEEEGGAAAAGDVDYEKKEKHHKHLEQLGGLGAIAAGAYAIVRIALDLSSLLAALLAYCICLCSRAETLTETRLAR